MNSVNKQVVLKPQDLVLALKLLLNREQKYTYASLANELVMSASEAHASLHRLQLSRLVGSIEPSSTAVNRAAVLEFIEHGLKYAFPGIFGSITRGIPTSCAGPSLREVISQSDEPTPVWPYADGSSRGLALAPLYPSVPVAASRDSALYDALTLVDAIRAGSARERAIAIDLLTARIT